LTSDSEVKASQTALRRPPRAAIGRVTPSIPQFRTTVARRDARVRVAADVPGRRNARERIATPVPGADARLRP
jgi:hypothetical protein